MVDPNIVKKVSFIPKTDMQLRKHIKTGVTSQEAVGAAEKDVVNT